MNDSNVACLLLQSLLPDDGYLKLGISPDGFARMEDNRFQACATALRDASPYVLPDTAVLLDSVANRISGE
jgi:hypothetical protein